MYKNYSFLCMLIFLLVVKDGLFAYALTSTQKGKILDNFKEQQHELIFDDDIIFDEQDRTIFSAASNMHRYSTMVDKVRQATEYLQKQKDSLSKRISSLEETINDLDADIAEMVKQAEQTNEDIVLTKEQIDKQQAGIEMLSHKIEENRAVLFEYIIYLYKKGNYVYEGENIDNLKAIILSGENIGELISDMHFKGTIEISGKKLIDQHRSFISTLYQKKLDLQNEESSLKMLRKSLLLEKKMLDDKKALKKRILEVSKGQESLYKKYISDKISLEKSVELKELQERIKFNNTKNKILEKYDCDYVDLAEDTVFSRTLTGQCLELNKVLYAESKLKSFDSSVGNILSWPVLPYYGISAFYKDAEYQDLFGATHDAVDIMVPQGTPIKVPADGYVIYISPPDSQDYAFFALQHGDGVVTVYGHVSEILVAENDFVKEGDIIGKTGGEYGTKGAGIMTTGPHLHFEVYKDKDSKDPLEYLDLSYLSYGNLPEKYKYKFAKDFKERKGYEYSALRDGISGRKVFSIEGATEIERQKYLLSKYAAPAFKDWNIWVEESVAGSIDPSFVMCIGLAESSLGNALKTSFNVGNVGNTDSGGTWNFPNARTGIYRIVKTLNNEFLRGYTKIEELSRYGNKKGSIYASSSDHWHNNIIKCLSHVKGEYVPDDYEFRIK